MSGNQSRGPERRGTNRNTEPRRFAEPSGLLRARRVS